MFSVSARVLRASLWLGCAYITSGLTGDQEGEGDQDKSDHGEKDDDDDDNNNSGKDNVEPSTDGYSA